ncbi:MAG: hypothetical protein ACFE7E_00075 [Candidatus Hodarchaeota archaeon]
MSMPLILLAGLIVRIFNVIRFPILPSAFDPWIHISITREIVENGRFFLDIYRGGFAFHTLMAFLQTVTGIPLLEMAKYMPIVIGMFSLVPMYVLVKEITNHEQIALLSTIILSTMAFDFIYATNQYWPELTTLSLIALVVLFFIKSIKNPSTKNALVGSLLFIVVTMSHDLSALVLASTLLAIQSLSLLLFKKYTLHSLAMVVCGLGFLALWLFTFAPTYMIGLVGQFSNVYLYFAGGFIGYIVLILVLRKLRQEGDFGRIMISRLVYVLGIILAVVLVAIVLLAFQIPFSQFLNETVSYYALAAPMWAIIILLTSIGAIILSYNLHWQSLIILSLTGGIGILFLLTFFLFLHGYYIIEIERILAFAFIGLSMICSVGFFTMVKKRNGYGRKILLSSMLVFMIVPASVWAFPSPEGGLPYLNWNTESEYWFALWGAQHIPQSMAISDWRIGYILRGFLPYSFGSEAVVINVILLYPENYPVIQNISQSYEHTIMIIDDWMIDNGPTQRISHGPTLPLDQAIVYYTINATYIKIFDNSKEWVYYVIRSST